MTVTVHRAADRFHTTTDWLDSWHSFSFGPHVDPTNRGHGLLVVSNDDVIAPGTGFGTHPHRDMEIVTWVLEGSLEHRDSEGNHGILEPGLAQRMTAGRGIRHSEQNASRTAPLHLVQMWVLPRTAGLDPGYEQAWVGDRLTGGGLVPIASGRGHDGAITIHADAACHVGHLAPREAVVLPDAPHVHVYVARGAVDLTGAPGSTVACSEGSGSTVACSEGSAARLTDAGPLGVTAGPDGAEVIVWETA